MKQWHYDVAPEVALECTKSQHVWVFDADVATQSHGFILFDLTFFQRFSV